MNTLIGKLIGNYKVICDFNNERVLAYNRHAPQPWVVWRVDKDGDMYYGKYFCDPPEARREFIQSVMDTRTILTATDGIKGLKTDMLEGYLTLKYKADTRTYDICSKHAYDFTDSPHHAWKVYLRELKTLTLKQVFEILNLEKARQ